MFRSKRPSLTASIGIMRRILMLACLLFAGTDAFEPAPIRWGGLQQKEFVIATSQHSFTNAALEPPLGLTIRAQESTMHAGEVPRFVAKADNTIIWHATGWCLEANLNEIRANHCNGRPNQLWTWLPWGPIQLKGSNKCLDVSGQSDLDGAPIELHKCENKRTETWWIEEPISRPIPPETLLAMRHMIYFSSMAAIGALSVAASLRWWSTRSRPVHQSNMPLTTDDGGLCLTKRSVSPQSSEQAISLTLPPLPLENAELPTLSRSVRLMPSVVHASHSAVGRRRTQPCATLAEAPSSDAEPSSKSSPSRQFLIGNKHNDVLKLECATRDLLRQGLLETSDVPHICIAGESNAGKSSVINHLLNKGNLARAGSVAGKTRSVDLMLVNDRVVLTDLPGLPSRDHQVAPMWEKTWRPLVFDYIRTCEQLHAMVYVHDVRWNVTKYIRTFLDEVARYDLPVLLLLTKDDKIVDELKLPKTTKPDAKREAEIALRERLMMRTRTALGFRGVHLHYSVNSEKAASRNARRRLLRYVESIVESGSRQQTRTLLDEIALDRFAGMAAR